VKRLGLMSVLLIVLVAVTMVIAFGCSKETSTSTATQTTTITSTQAAKTLDIGSIEGLSGPVSDLYQIINMGEKLAVDWINEKGGITIKGQKYNINLVSYDDKLSADGAVTAAQKAIFQDNIKFLEGEVTPFLAEAIQTIASPNKIFFMSSQYDALTIDFPYTFSAYFPYVASKPVEYDYLVKAYPNVKKVAVAHMDEAANNRCAARAEVEIKSHGLTMTINEPYPFMGQDYLNLVTKLMATNPDAIDFNSLNPTHAAMAIKEARQLGFTGPILMNSPCDMTVVKGMIGNDAYATDAFMPTWDKENPPANVPLLAEIIKRYEDTYNVTFQLDSLRGWDPVYTLVQCIEGAQSLDPTEVKAFAEKMGTIQTGEGPAKMTGAKTFGFNCCVVSDCPLTRFKDGKIEFIGWYPLDVP
jgi:branched-chain amino acid transport system substrate-binding protein